MSAKVIAGGASARERQMSWVEAELSSYTFVSRVSRPDVVAERLGASDEIPQDVFVCTRLSFSSSRAVRVVVCVCSNAGHLPPSEVHLLPPGYRPYCNMWPDMKLGHIL